ncbi:MAG: hypothetical protein ABFS35_10590 [Bacteroidota bacterium]
MSYLRFNHQQKKRKTWLFPLIVIILLYVSIPFLLIQRGDETLKKAISQTESEKMETPSKDYNAGIVFLEIAEAFPGFTAWAKQIQKSSGQKMLEIYELKCTQKSSELFRQISNYTNEYDSLSVHFKYSNEVLYLNAIVFKDQEKENMKIMVSNELRNELQIKFCNVWKKFFLNLNVIVPKHNSICQL